MIHFEIDLLYDDKYIRLKRYTIFIFFMQFVQLTHENNINCDVIIINLRRINIVTYAIGSLQIQYTENRQDP